ncbi:MAG TPA: DUF1801 domain-containing protein [Rhizobiaceae bacterium]|nr:DUF1801 domain-containing protein [Rhizobiaceae bacterium]
MTENKTKPTGASVEAFVDGLADVRRRDESRQLLGLMARATRLAPQMWGPSIVGYGRYRYRYDSGHSGESMLTGFSPRKGAMTVYIVPGFKPYGDLLARLGPHTHSVSCLYLKRLDKIDAAVLEELVVASVNRMREIYPETFER